MDKKIQNISLVSALILSIIIAFFDKTISAGIILGSLFSRIHLQLLSIDMQQMIQSGRAKAHSFSSLIRLLLLALPMLIAMLFPQKISIIGVVIGLLLMKICFYVSAFIRRKEVK